MAKAAKGSLCFRVNVGYRHRKLDISGYRSFDISYVERSDSNVLRLPSPRGIPAIFTQMLHKKKYIPDTLVSNIEIVSIASLVLPIDITWDSIIVPHSTPFRAIRRTRCMVPGTSKTQNALHQVLGTANVILDTTVDA